MWASIALVSASFHTPLRRRGIPPAALERTDSPSARATRDRAEQERSMSGAAPRWTRLRRSAFHARQEIIRARLSRREMLKLGLLTSAGTLAAIAGLSDRASSDEGGCGPSPRTPAFVDPLPIMPILPPVPLAALDPAPHREPNHAINP